MSDDSGKPKEGTQQKEQPQKSEWTPEAVEYIIKLIDTLAGRYVGYKHEEAEADNRYLEVATRHNQRLTYALVIFLAIVVVLMSILAYLKVVSGDALLFLTGTITGYILLFIQKIIFSVGPERPKPQAQESL